MLTAKKPNPIAKSILGILLAAALLTATYPITAYAAENNPVGNSLDVFPALGVSSDTMDENLGTVNTLYSGGIIKDNKGNISSSRGTVFENHGSIENLSAGHVGTNNGTINYIENTGSLSVNDKGGKVLFISMGNVVDRNDGMIQDNAGTVSENYGTVSDNYGTVIMHDGQIVNNYQNGTVAFEAKISGGETISAKGTIENNKGTVEANSGAITIKENTGDIEINNATVSVEKNSGSITVGKNAKLICSENTSGGAITKADNSAEITCNSNNGTINDETAAMYKIVFIGDDGQAVIKECDYEEGGVYYTKFEGAVLFTLPPEYECSDATKWESGDVNTWVVNAYPAEGDTEFTIICHKCSPGEYRMTPDKHWQICAGCGKTLTDTEGAHTFSGNTCTVCGYTKPSSGGYSSGRSAPATYSVVPSECEHGSVTVSPKVASAGDTVTITVSPDKGYTLETITVTDKGGKNAALTAAKVGETYSFKMPADDVSVEATFMEDNTMLNYFVDVTAEDYYYDAVLWAAGKSITSGVDAVHFDPNGTCTRAQVVTFLWRAAGCPEVETGDTFTDVVKGSHYEKAVAWAVAEEITSGTSKAAFSPDAECTRAQIVTFLWRTAGSPAILNMTASGPANPFSDIDAADYYYDAVLWAVGQGITEGTTAATFSPNNTCTRDQIVTFLYRYMA